MMLKKTNVLSSYALAATVALFAALVCGCDRREEVYPVEGDAYLRDPEFNAQLAQQVEKRKQITADFAKYQERFNALLAKCNGDIAAATNTPEGVELAAALTRCEESFKSNRLASAAMMRERRKRAVEDSARIRRGEAKAIDISKLKEAK